MCFFFNSFNNFILNKMLKEIKTTAIARILDFAFWEQKN